MPLAKVANQRQKEAELRRSLREMRTAIDKFKDAVDMGLIPATEIRTGSEGYPPDLETLVEGVTVANDASGRKLKFLRRIPIDPLTNSTEWGLARVSGSSPRCVCLGRAERLRRLHRSRRAPRSTARSTRTGRRGRLMARRVAHAEDRRAAARSLAGIRVGPSGFTLIELLIVSR